MQKQKRAEAAWWFGGALIIVAASAHAATAQQANQSATRKTPALQNVEKGKSPSNAQSSEKSASTSPPPFGFEIPANLGEPLVDSRETLQRLDRSSPVWLDKKNKCVVLLGSACKANYPLEFFATYPDRGYESVVVVYTKPSIVHAALLAIGAKPGKPAQYRPKFTAASGTEIEIEVAWKGADGKRQKARAQDWIREIKTGKPLRANWVFAGSMFWKDDSAGATSYLADRGDFISVTSLPTAMLDLPLESHTAIESRAFEGFVERLPAPGTPITLVIKPRLGQSAK